MSLNARGNKTNQPGSSSAKSALTSRRKGAARIIAITGGKGGVGRTNVAANLAVCLSALGKRVVVLDGDLGLANMDVLLGLTPKFSLGHLINGTKEISEIMIDGPEGIKIIPACSGIQQLTELSAEQKRKIVDSIKSLDSNTDFLLIDTAAGISDNVMHFLDVANEIVIVCSPEPTAVVDAYAFIKSVVSSNKEKPVRILVNSVEDSQEAEQVFNQINRVVWRFLNRKVELFGYIYADSYVPAAVKGQTSVVVSFPNCRASLCFKNLARQLIETTPENYSLPRSAVKESNGKETKDARRN